jgi:hypothetical protein
MAPKNIFVFVDRLWEKHARREHTNINNSGVSLLRVCSKSKIFLLLSRVASE